MSAGNDDVQARGPFLEWPRNVSGPKANFKSKSGCIEAQFLAHLPDDFASSRSLYLIIFKIIENLMINANTANTKHVPGSKRHRDFRETAPC